MTSSNAPQIIPPYFLQNGPIRLLGSRGENVCGCRNLKRRTNRRGSTDSRPNLSFCSLPETPLSFPTHIHPDTHLYRLDGRLGDLSHLGFGDRGLVFVQGVQLKDRTHTDTQRLMHTDTQKLFAARQEAAFLNPDIGDAVLHITRRDNQMTNSREARSRGRITGAATPAAGVK